MTARRKKKKEVTATDEVSQLREYVAEAEQVELLKTHPGWEIIEADLQLYKSSLSEKLPYLEPYTKEFKEARTLYIAADKSLKIFEDYAENKVRAMELLKKLDNPQDSITLDVDNQINNA